MNINRHNYEEYLIDYLEGNLNAETLAALQVFFKENPDVEAEVNLLAQDMPVLMPDTAVVYARKESLKKPETGGKTVFWSLNYPRFYTLSLAAALLLFSFGWFVMKYTLNQQPIRPNAQAPAVIANKTQTTNTAIPENPITTMPQQTETPPQTQPTAHAGVAQTSAPQTPRKSKTKTASQTSHTYYPTVAAAAPANLPTPATTPAQVLPSAQNPPAHSPKLPAPQTLASLTAQQLPLTNYVTVATPQYLPYPTHPEPNRQTPLQNKLVREVGRRLLAQNKQAKSTTKNGDESANVVAKLADALLPEAIAAANPKLANPDITLSVTVNSGTHQFIRDFLNK